MKLYIIGNGFDRHHGIPCQYKDFYNWLGEDGNDQEQRLEFREKMEKYYNPSELWFQFEEALAHMDVDSCLGEFEYLLPDPKREEYRMSDYYGFSDEVMNEMTSIDFDIKYYFRHWIMSLRKAPINNQILDFIDPNGIYLNFNYTLTLETIYRINSEHILHIHGYLLPGNDAQFSQLVLGHGDRNVNIWPDDDSEINPYYDEALNNIHQHLLSFIKPIEDIIEQNKNFWTSLNKVTEIYVLGHSMEGVDFPYYEKICQNIDKDNVVWNFSYYSDSDLERIERIANKLGIEHAIKERFRLTDKVKTLFE